MSNILNEELGRMKSLFSYHKGKVISEQGFNPYQAVLGNTNTNPGPVQQAPTSSNQSTNQLPLYGQQPLVNCAGISTSVMDTPPAASQIDFAQKSGLNPNVEANKQFFCSYQKMSAKLAEVQKTGKTTQNKPATPKLNWIPEKFPLKYMMQGPNVKKLQQALDVRNKSGQPNITGKFYNATQVALDKKVKELGLSYDRNVGLDEVTFNKIVNKTITIPAKYGPEGETGAPIE